MEYMTTEVGKLIKERGMKLINLHRTRVRWAESLNGFFKRSNMARGLFLLILGYSAFKNNIKSYGESSGYAAIRALERHWMMIDSVWRMRANVRMATAIINWEVEVVGEWQGYILYFSGTMRSCSDFGFGGTLSNFLRICWTLCFIAFIVGNTSCDASPTSASWDCTTTPIISSESSALRFTAVIAVMATNFPGFGRSMWVLDLQTTTSFTSWIRAVHALLSWHRQKPVPHHLNCSTCRKHTTRSLFVGT